MLHDREPEAGSTRRACAIGAVEALEDARELGLFDADAVVGAADGDHVALPLHGEREGRARTGVANRVLGEVPGDDPEHPGPDRELDVVVALEPKLDSGPRGALGELVDRLLEHGLHRGSAERDDTSARLELAEEQHLVDELRDLVDLATRLLDERGDVLAGKRRRLEERQEPGKRCAELVRDRRGETCAKLLVCGEIALAREVDEALAPAADLVRDHERDDSALAREKVAREAISFTQTVDRLARAPARVKHAIRFVEHDDRLPALLDEHSSPGRVGIRHVTRF